MMIATTNAIIEIPLMKLTFLAELKSANRSSVRYPLQQTKVLMLYLTNTNCPYTITYRSIKIFIPKFLIMDYICSIVVQKGLEGGQNEEGGWVEGRQSWRDR